MITFVAAVAVALYPMPDEGPTDRGIRHGAALLGAGLALLWGLP